MTLEESLCTVRANISGLSHEIHDRAAVKNRLDAPPELAQTESLANIADTEDSVDAMGTVAFADEEDCGFFGRIVTFFAKKKEFSACDWKRL